ncbi:MAG: Kelch repeat-containing protein [Candidatus Polarisedimenticolia bacterium]
MSATRIALLGAMVLGNTVPVHAALTFEQRVAAEEAIQRVRYRHQIDARRPFEQAISVELMERRVLEYLRGSVALERIWHTPVTAAALRRELERMVRDSKSPERLKEIFAALGNDPLLVEECLARPTLVHRLLSSFGPGGLDAGDLDGSAAVAGAPRSVAPAPLPVLRATSPACHPDDTWDEGSLMDPPEVRWGHTAVWTGSEMIVWGGGDGRRYDPVIDIWKRIPAGPPGGDVAFWTGSEMLVFGFSAAGPFGSRFDPATGAWSPMSTAGAPSRRSRTSATWTGREMIVWGGQETGGGAVQTGARYDPVSDSWTPMSTQGAPSARFGHAAAWTGTELIIWGGRAADSSIGGRYDPATNTWKGLSASGAPVFLDEVARFDAVWTGEAMLAIGRIHTDLENPSAAGIYHPDSDTWSPMAGPITGSDGPYVWTGTELLLWGGYDGQGGSGGVRYDPARDRWSRITNTGAPDTDRTGHTLVWAGDRMIVFGGHAIKGTTAYSSGGRYDPVSDSWTPTSMSNGGPSPRSNHAAFWTGNEMIVWGRDHEAERRGGRYDPATDSWRLMSSVSAPHPHPYPIAAAWTGEDLFVWAPWFDAEHPGGLYRPADDAWRPVTTEAAPVSLATGRAVWTGTEAIVLGHDCPHAACTPQVTGGRYDPGTDSWRPMSLSSIPEGFSAVWTGQEILVPGLGGAPGGRYDPEHDLWSPLSATGAPPYPGPIVWTGTQILAWQHDGRSWLLHGYEPAADLWTLLPEAGPVGPVRGELWSVWTGEELLSWWGAGGARFDPLPRTWVAISQENQPSHRDGASVVWTGDSMIVWGGLWADFAPVATGGRYFLGADRDRDGDGFTSCGGDCAEGDPDVNPAALERPGDSIDENCDGIRLCDPAGPWKNRGQFNACLARAHNRP